MAQASSAGGGSVFDCSVKIPRRVPDPGTDCKLPPAGALNYAGITDLSALMTTSGTAVSLVTGDHFEMMHGNEIRTVFLDRDHTILGNQSSTVVQDRHDVVQANYNQHINGATQRYHNGATNETFNAEHVNSHASPRQMHEPTGYYKVVNEKVENVNKAAQNYGYKADVIMVKTEASLVSAMEWASVGIEGKGTEIAYQTISGHEFGILKTKATAAEQDFEALKSRVAAVENHVGELKSHETAVFFVPVGFGVYI